MKHKHLLIIFIQNKKIDKVYKFFEMFENNFVNLIGKKKANAPTKTSPPIMQQQPPSLPMSMMMNGIKPPTNIPQPVPAPIVASTVNTPKSTLIKSLL
jgi:hypothetical protein